MYLRVRVAVMAEIIQRELLNLKQKFVNRDYPSHIVNTQVNKLLTIDRNKFKYINI